MSMDLGLSKKGEELRDRIRAFIDNKVLAVEEEYHAEVGKNGNRFEFTPRMTEILENLKAEARKDGLWNFWLTGSENGFGLTTVEYAYLAEEMGRSHLAAESFNCSAPDTGNMEVIERYGTEAHKEKWLKPLLDGKIRSAYLMTEPSVASSDATNISMSAVLDGDHYVLNGEKYWASGAGDPRCKIYVTMVKTGDDDAPRHNKHSMILVEAGTPGIEILRPMMVFGHDDAPHGHMHIRFTNVRVPKENLILGEGRGFEVSQGRLGPGRIHHCMRSIGAAERALELLIKRSLSKEAFGKTLVKLGANYDIIAECRIEIEMARLLCLKAAYMMDTIGTQAAQPYISQIKVVAPRMALKVIDESMQMHGGQGISQDFPLASMWHGQRTLRFADGPDAVHRMVIARTELKKYRSNSV
ncbi:MAG: acyl-CoA dehydrogenase [Alphaproteobacteria bacterium]|nr:MAG: acyl-CoA dehydrogenase [Alphaproteobacteria bacterium]